MEENVVNVVSEAVEKAPEVVSVVADNVQKALEPIQVPADIIVKVAEKKILGMSEQTAKDVGVLFGAFAAGAITDRIVVNVTPKVKSFVGNAWKKLTTPKQETEVKSDTNNSAPASESQQSQQIVAAPNQEK